MLTRIAAVCGLLVLAPVSAEYLYGYDDSTGDLTELLGGLLIFIPLYGAAAVIIREAARRAGRGRPTILLLGTAFGVLQAGLIDHSMFNPNYRGIEYWDDIFGPTVVPGLGVSLALAVQFTVGHLVWSIAVPIAIVESFVPARRTTPAAVARLVARRVDGPGRESRALRLVGRPDRTLVAVGRVESAASPRRRCRCAARQCAAGVRHGADRRRFDDGKARPQHSCLVRRHGIAAGRRRSRTARSCHHGEVRKT